MTSCIFAFVLPATVERLDKAFHEPAYVWMPCSKWPRNCTVFLLPGSCFQSLDIGTAVCYSQRSLW